MLLILNNGFLNDYVASQKRQVTVNIQTFVSCTYPMRETRQPKSCLLHHHIRRIITRRRRHSTTAVFDVSCGKQTDRRTCDFHVFQINNVNVNVPHIYIYVVYLKHTKITVSAEM